MIEKNNQKLSGLYSRINGLTDWKNITIHKVEKLQQTILENEEQKKTIKTEVKKIGKRIKNLPNENPLNFTEHLEKQREENEVDIF